MEVTKTVKHEGSDACAGIVPSTTQTVQDTLPDLPGCADVVKIASRIYFHVEFTDKDGVSKRNLYSHKRTCTKCKSGVQLYTLPQTGVKVPVFCTCVKLHGCDILPEDKTSMGVPDVQATGQVVSADGVVKA